MKKNTSLLIGIVLCLASLLQQCVCNNFKFTPTLPETPQNMTEANSVYDDMNARDPQAGDFTHFYFSSNRNSKGKEFDIISAQFLFVFNRSDRNTRNETKLNGALLKDYHFGGMQDHYYVYNQVPKLLPLVNTEYNELGPCGYTQNKNDGFFKHFILYSNDSKGDLDIKYAYTVGKYTVVSSGFMNEDSVTIEQKGNFIAALLNSGSDDAYPSIDDVNGIIYFCSNRSGKFQIYQVKYDPSKDLADELQSTKNQPEIIPSIAGNANDKCPFVKSNVMVFVSDREGSMGGFDLYYSLRGTDGVWGTPLSFGSAINTSHDEYRPIIDKLGGFSNNLLIFSSNRPGGLGGYDLYYVGVPKLIAE